MTSYIFESVQTGELSQASAYSRQQTAACLMILHRSAANLNRVHPIMPLAELIVNPTLMAQNSACYRQLTELYCLQVKCARLPRPLAELAHLTGTVHEFVLCSLVVDLAYKPFDYTEHRQSWLQQPCLCHQP